MLQDLSDHPDGTVLNTDICIIGGGPAGISMARHLIGSSHKVLLLESGGKEVDKDQQALASATETGVKYGLLGGNRLRALGGTTGHWAGQSYPLDPLDFKPRSWVPNSGWPIPHSELTKWLTPAAEACGLGNQSFAFGTWGQKTGIENPFTQLEVATLRFSTPHVHFGKAYADELTKASNITVMLHATMEFLQPTGNGKGIAHAVVRHLDGRTVTVKAKRFVLATGALENSRLLLTCQAKTGNPFGNGSDKVGRYTMEHPRIDTGHVILENTEAGRILHQAKRKADGMRLRFDVRLSDADQEKLQILNHTVVLAKKRKPTPASKGVVKLLNAWSSERDVKKRSFSLRVRLEHSPLENSRITLHASEKDRFDRPKLNLNFAFGELEARTVAALEKAMALRLGRAQVGRMMVPNRKNPKAWAKYVGWQHHHLGGTRMSADPNTGVVDANCKVHGLDNLYCAGGSVFPTGGHANPTMNLVALSLRLADHLKETA